MFSRTALHFFLAVTYVYVLSPQCTSKFLKDRHYTYLVSSSLWYQIHVGLAWPAVAEKHVNQCDEWARTCIPALARTFAQLSRGWSTTPWEDSIPWWESGPLWSVYTHSVLSATGVSTFSSSPSKSQSVPCSGNFFQLGARGLEPTFLDTVVTTWPSVGGEWVPATSGLPLDQNDPIPCPASLVRPPRRGRPGRW